MQRVQHRLRKAAGPQGLASTQPTRMVLRLSSTWPRQIDCSKVRRRGRSSSSTVASRASSRRALCRYLQLTRRSPAAPVFLAKGLLAQPMLTEALGAGRVRRTSDSWHRKPRPRRRCLPSRRGRAIRKTGIHVARHRIKRWSADYPMVRQVPRGDWRVVDEWGLAMAEPPWTGRGSPMDAAAGHRGAVSLSCASVTQGLAGTAPSGHEPGWPGRSMALA